MKIAQQLGATTRVGLTQEAHHFIWSCLYPDKLDI